MEENTIFELIERYGFHIIIIFGVGTVIFLGSVIRILLKKRSQRDSKHKDQKEL